jgi:hypothetical protein
MALLAIQVATYIAEARAAGIKLVGASAIPEQVSVRNGHHDAYVSVREDASSPLQAWFTIADSDGKARVTWLWDPGYPSRGRRGRPAAGRGTVPRWRARG